MSRLFLSAAGMLQELARTARRTKLAATASFLCELQFSVPTVTRISARATGPGGVGSRRGVGMFVGARKARLAGIPEIRRATKRSGWSGRSETTSEAARLRRKKKKKGPRVSAPSTIGGSSAAPETIVQMCSRNAQSGGSSATRVVRQATAHRVALRRLHHCTSALTLHVGDNNRSVRRHSTAAASSSRSRVRARCV